MERDSHGNITLGKPIGRRKFLKEALILGGAGAVSGGLFWLLSKYDTKENFDRVVLDGIEYMVFPHFEKAYRMEEGEPVQYKGWESATRTSLGHVLNPETSDIDLVSKVEEYNKIYHNINGILRMGHKPYLPKEITEQESIKLFGK